MNPLINSLAGRIVSRGHLAVTDHAGQVRHYGDGSGNPVHLRFNTARAERAVALDPALKLGECYMQGEIDMVEGDVFALLELLFTNSGPYATATAPWMRALNRVRLALSQRSLRIGIGRARRNVQHHYDLSGKLYDLFLDEDRQYSCAYYREPEMSLEAAQRAKKEHIAAKLLLDRPGLSVLDIGSGWGGLGLYISRSFDADVTGITLSDEQLAYANRRILPREEHRVRFLLKDFRKLDDRFDRIVSVGMFEHVGKAAFDTYFAQSAKLLKRDGVMVLHAIGRLDVPSWTNPFITKYIFPGGYIPSLSEVIPPIERSGLKIMDVEILRLHYADTLRDWRERFMSRRDEAKALYDEAFCRMWEFYLAASESAFRWQNLMVFQIQLAHDIGAVPLTRDYIADAERQLTAHIQPRRTG
ncbi:class I SAM-dependent methyltransferase [Georhizobium profundi]|uniref:Class I SAM-dependent methyltransferase n=1 Tax=Georhizobium profundi TaxID=2341112 RepID=A0A3S9B6A7_9HYPH|nr:cyclopropane-fatty-acyl-phospholipid synthase family protein [Georhizobium profundi]AZN72453.1 class I SAM-dependent methyltransferase [Georhizobium profundi]